MVATVSASLEHVKCKWINKSCATLTTAALSGEPRTLDNKAQLQREQHGLRDHLLL